MRVATIGAIAGTRKLRCGQALTACYITTRHGVGETRYVRKRFSMGRSSRIRRLAMKKRWSHQSPPICCATRFRRTAISRMTRKRPDKSCQLRGVTQRALIVGNGRSGSQCVPSGRSHISESGERLRQCKAGSGRFRVISPIAVRHNWNQRNRTNWNQRDPNNRIRPSTSILYRKRPADINSGMAGRRCSTWKTSVSSGVSPITSGCLSTAGALDDRAVWALYSVIAACSRRASVMIRPSAETWKRMSPPRGHTPSLVGAGYRYTHH